jgi:hypothetical protein
MRLATDSEIWKKSEKKVEKLDCHALCQNGGREHE